MFAIVFDGLNFTTIEALSTYVAETYGSWAEVPAKHPQYALVQALRCLNEDCYAEQNGVAVYVGQEDDLVDDVYGYHEYSDGGSVYDWLHNGER